MPTLLTPEQKTARKEAAALRAKAFKERKNAYRKELRKAREAVKRSDVGIEFEANNLLHQQVLHERLRALNEIFEKIQDIKREEQQVTIYEKQLGLRSEGLYAEMFEKVQDLKCEAQRAETEHNKVIEQVDQSRAMAHKAFFAALHAAEAEVDARYEDVKDCRSAAGWRALEEFIERATQEVTP